jgi:AhpD family alkylhydroperoxidase
MSRIQKVAVENWDPELRRATAADDGTPLEQGLIRMMANAPDMAKAVTGFGGALMKARALPRRLVELVRLRIAFHNQCRSCMAIRYKTAIDDGLTEGMVCSLERPQDASDLTPAEKAAIAYADQASTDHFSIDDSTFDRLREHFTEGEIVELCIFAAFFIGFGRLGASWDMVEELPYEFQKRSAAPIVPWGQDAITVRG